jgi:hypothetical protein
MTHARTQPTTADYRTLTPETQQRFDELMQQADTAGTHQHFHEVMAQAASLVGIPLPVSGDIRRCACSCVCGAIFDAEDPDAHVIEWAGGYNLGRVQCPTCADRHRETA